MEGSYQEDGYPDLPPSRPGTQGLRILCRQSQEPGAWLQFAWAFSPGLVFLGADPAASVSSQAWRVTSAGEAVDEVKIQQQRCLPCVGPCGSEQCLCWEAEGIHLFSCPGPCEYCVCLPCYIKLTFAKCLCSYLYLYRYICVYVSIYVYILISLPYICHI